MKERVFSKLENRFGMITGRNIKSVCEPPLSLRAREQAKLNQDVLALVLEKVRGIYNSMSETITSYALGTKKKISDNEAIIVLRKIRIVLPYFLPLRRVEMPEASQLRRVLKLHWSDKIGNGKNNVIGGAQSREKLNRVS